MLIFLRLKYLLFCIVLILINADSFSQQIDDLRYRHYGTEDGFPSSTVMYILQDTKGYVWFSTDAGVSRFDGYGFKNFNKNNGLPDNLIHTMYEDREGRIWFIGMKWELSYFLNDSIHLFNPGNQLEGLNANGIFQDNQGALWFYFNDGRIFRFFNGNLKKLNEVIKNLPEGQIGFTQDGIERYVVTSAAEYGFLQDTSFVVHEYPRDLVQSIGLVKLFTLKSGKVLGITRTYLFLIEEDNIKIIFPNKNEIGNYYLNMVKEDNDGNLLLATNHGVLLLKKSGFGYITINTFLPSKSINMALEDRENNLWFSTRDEGIYFLSGNASRIKNIGQNEGLKSNAINTVIKLSDGTLCMGSQNGLLEFYNSKKSWFLNIGTNTLTNINCLHLDLNGTIWCGADGGIVMVPEKETERFKPKIWKTTSGTILPNSQPHPVKVPHYYSCIIGSSIKSISPGKGDDIWFTKSTGIVKITRETGVNPDYVVTIYSSSRANGLAVADNGKIWYCSPNGLSYFLNDSTRNSAEFVLQSANITDIGLDKNDVLWIATNGSGIYLYKDTIISNITIDSSLSSNIVNSILVNGNSVWAATTKGISKITPKDKAYSGFDMLKLGKMDGLPSEEINSLYMDGDTMYAATNKGVSIFNQSEVSANYFAPPVFIEGIKIKGQDTLVQNGLSLRHVQNDISFSVLGISYKESAKLVYKYQLIGAEEEWKISRTREINYPLLPPGDYTFVVKAVNSDKVESAVPAEISFSIQPPFWQTAWFNIIVALSSLIILTGIIWAIIRYYRNKNELINRIFESEQKALRAQMNPHFVFNALYSIQNFITKNDQYSANLYLAKFSDLVRMTLDYSRNVNISIAEEIKFLRTYLELESLRFENKFDYKIEVDQSVDVYKTKILSMLIQPFVENSIKHGLLPKKTKGKLKIILLKENGFLSCVIEDNGIGRERAQEFQKAKTSRHRSQGINITEERLELIKHGDKKGSIFFVDLQDDDGKASGTKVIIKIPYSNN